MSKKIVFLLVALLVVLSLAAAGYYGYQYYNLKQHPEQLNQASADALKTRVGKLILLPSETPQIAVVQDVDKLKKDQPFFTNAQNGDQILIFPEAKKAVLYRSASNQIIEVGPLLDKPEAATGSSSAGDSSTKASTSSTSSSAPVPATITPVDTPSKAH